MVHGHGYLSVISALKAQKGVTWNLLATENSCIYKLWYLETQTQCIIQNTNKHVPWNLVPYVLNFATDI